eukprot:5995144-Pyramimonas_sp.AAC.1
MARSTAMVFAGHACYGVEARLLVRLSSILPTRTATDPLELVSRNTSSSSQLGRLLSRDRHSARTPRRAAADTHSVE